MTDREWGLLAPFMPPPRPVGRPRKADLREVTNAILYLVSTGCQWRQLDTRNNPLICDDACSFAAVTMVFALDPIDPGRL